MSMLYSTGRYANVLSRGTVTSYPSASSVAPNAGLFDGDPSCPRIAGSIVANNYDNVDINAVVNGTFEAGSAGSLPTSFSAANSGTGSGVITTTAGEFRTGSKALKLTAGTGVGWVYQTITARAGEWRQSRAWARYVGSGALFFYVYNTQTGKYWTGSAWSASVSYATVGTLTGSFAVGSTTYQVEDFDTCRADTVTLQIGLYCNAGVACVDDYTDVPGVNACAIFGHNLGPISMEITSTIDGSSTSRATPTIRRGSFFSSFAIAYATSWTVYYNGTPIVTPYVGELWLGQFETCATSPKWGLSKTRTIPGVRNTSPGRRTTAISFSLDPTQDIALEFSGRTSTADKELCESLWLRSGQGRYPVVLVPIDTESDVCHGRILEPVTTARPFTGVYDTSMTLLGDPFPTVGA